MQILRAFLLFAAMAVVSAGPPGSHDPDESIRRGNEAFDRGDYDAADRHYLAAIERTTDPGLVAFNRAAVAVRRGDVRDGEVNYIRTLEDKAIQPARQARALYNRGVCLLMRGGSAETYRSAIERLEQAAEHPGADASLADDARHNLELAKLLWNKARLREKSSPRPNDLPPDVYEPPPPRGQADKGSDPGPNEFGTEGPNTGRPEGIANQGSKGGQAKETQQKTAGMGNLPVRLDPDHAEGLSTEDARALLRDLANRFRKDRQDNARLTAGPERPNVRDW